MHVLNLVTTKRPFFNSQVNALESNGVKQTTISVPNNWNPEEGKGRSVTDYLRFYPNVLRESTNSYDLIHANNGLTAPHAIMQTNLPVVISFWGLDVASNTYKKAWISKVCARVADEVIVMSDEMEETLGVDAHVIPHGVDTSLFKPTDPAKAREIVGWDDSRKHVLFPYSPARTEKNHELAERIVEQVNKNIEPSIELHAVHDVSHSDIPHYMNASDLLLLTSMYEGSPNSVKEAMACNTPVVSTKVGDVAERLGPVSNSYVCSRTDELVQCARKVLESNEQSDGRKFIEPVTLERMGERIMRVYEKVKYD